jgi:hypothetical protein
MILAHDYDGVDSLLTTKVGIIDTDNFGLLRCSQSESRDEVHDPEDNSRHDHRVGETRGQVGLVTIRTYHHFTLRKNLQIGTPPEPSCDQTNLPGSP